METFDAWAVAAAILATGNQYERTLHYRTLADRVIGTGLTTLGRKGSTPAQTLGVILREHKDVFGCPDPGYYCLQNPGEVIERPVVARAIAALNKTREEKEAAGELASLRQEVQKLRERNALLERRMAEIVEICTDASGV